ncbi:MULTISPECIES: NADH-quinone oxidoreductase subunit B family protein [Streptomyces]|uniref:NADH-quinone oxidoreductase subunit B family protein n=1 Tax=Streptomyces TaxID=1883 RepID=UPI0013713E63|nr:oxidoreductase [Streptomyces sp. SID2888]MYV45415.1 oxidoreductase [Streptomyces sp. SID2888]
MSDPTPPPEHARPRLGVFKFASCDGCQLTLLDCEDELLGIAEELEIAHFLEASGDIGSGPFDLSLVEGSVSTPEHLERVRCIRDASRHLVTIGACATAGGVQALRNHAGTTEYLEKVYARPDYIATLACSTPISAHVPVDFELRGCPIDRGQLLEVVTAFLIGRKPGIPDHSVCFSCKQRDNVCVLVAHGTPCLGPVTHAGCGALCPTYGRGCYGCFGPAATTNLPALIPVLRHDGMHDDDIGRFLHTFNVTAFAALEEEEGP